MATKKTETAASKARTQQAAKKTSKTAAPKAAASKGKGAPKAKSGPKPKAAPTGPRHPRARLLAAYGSKESLAKSLATTLARPDEDTDIIAARLRTASNRQLLRLATVTEAVKKKWGSREKLIAAIGAAKKKSKDQDYLARLDTFSLPRLLDLAASAERHARA
jgi:hypothetical protein